MVRAGVGRKTPDDLEIEERIRAHVRERMERMGLGVTEAAEKIGCSQGNLTKILQKSRGLGLGMAVRMMRALGMDFASALLRDPERRFFEPYVPRGRDEANGTPPNRKR